MLKTISIKLNYIEIKPFLILLRISWEPFMDPWAFPDPTLKTAQVCVPLDIWLLCVNVCACVCVYVNT